MKLITELTDNVASLVVEYADKKMHYFIEGPFIQTEIWNRNNRKYPRSMMEQEIENYTKNMIETKRAIGELGHPPTPALDHERASHLIESLTPYNNDWIGKARVLTSLPKGRLVKGLIDEGVNFGVSTRGVGGLKKTREGTIVENYKLATAADIVTDPSGPGCFVNGIMEGAEWIYNSTDDAFVQQQLEDTRNELANNWKQVDESKILDVWTKFLKTL